MEGEGQNTDSKINYNLLIYLAIAFVVWRFSDSLFSLFQKGEGDKAGETIEKKGALDWKKYMGNIKGKQKKGQYVLSITGKEALEIVKGISEEWDNLVSHDSVILDELKKAGTKGDMVLISKVYSIVNKKDLYTILKKRLSDDSKKDIFEFINNLPDYIKK
jgi:hypothetical protein